MVAYCWCRALGTIPPARTTHVFTAIQKHLNFMNQPSPKLTTPKTPNLIGKRKKTFFSHSDIKSQLQKLSLYSDISSAGSDSNNHFGLQGLGPIHQEHSHLQVLGCLSMLPEEIHQSEGF
ncbi:hypothetical protein BY996DRAFT_6418381 [Phakopsora pachyrhizi]|nr:hypothetical protein BY996DRAFT_6418381 [Phakopsora pachyrhizi]